MGIVGEADYSGPDPEQAFVSFVDEVELRLHRALAATWGLDTGREATAEALAWAWENWSKVESLDNPAGYLYRVGASKVRTRRKPIVDYADELVGEAQSASDPARRSFEPALVPALRGLSERQQTVVVLVHGCGWTHQEVADALELSRSSVGTHLGRALTALRSELGVDHDA